MVSCEGCGAVIDVNDKACPYCGHSILQRAEARQSDVENQRRTYETSRDDEGNTQVRFGDGLTGHRPSSRSGFSSTYRRGAGSQGSVSPGHLEQKLDHVSRQLERIPDPSKHKGSKDEGVVLLELMSSLGDMMSVYQDNVFSEAHLSTDDRDRLSKKEERIRPKLKSMVAFCEKVDSKTQKKMGLSDSDIHKIRTTATRALQMTETRSGECSRCGATNTPNSRQCQNCGANL